MRSGIFSKPPAGAQINWGHPLAHGLRGAWLFNERAGIWVRDLVTGRNAARTSGSGAADWGKGNGLYVGSGNPGYVTTDNGPAIINAPGYSFATRASRITTSGAGAVVAMGSSGSSGTTPHVRYTAATTLQWGLYFDDLNVTIPTVASGRVSDVVVLLRGNRSQEAYEGGILRGSRTASLGSYTQTNTRIAFGAQSWDFNNGLQCLLHHCYVWARALSADEAEWLAAEPYDLLQPASVVRRYFLPLGTAGGTTGGTVASASVSGVAEAYSTANIRVTQEVAEAVFAPTPNVLVTQDVVEVVTLPATVGDSTASAGVSGTAVTVALGSGDTAASASQSGTAAVLGAAVRVTQEVAEAVFAPTPNVLVTQDVVEVVTLPATVGDSTASAGVSGTAVTVALGSGDTAASASQSGTAAVLGAAVRVTQEVAEAVYDPTTANVRVTQEALEVIVPSGTVVTTGAWSVSPTPQAAWTGNVPVVGWSVSPAPRVEWDARAGLTGDNWIVRPMPLVKWRVRAGVVSTECLGGTGIIPPPDPRVDDPSEQNYVF